MLGDLYGAFNDKKSTIKIKNIEALTCFADYRIPQILRHQGVLVYSQILSEIVDSKQEIDHGSKYEIEIRACMVQGVEHIKQRLVELGVNWTSVEIDWLLWQVGEEQKDSIKPHHRTLSIFY